ncbi:hypothetical protein H4J38_01820 [Colwellia sp. BRX10-3]|uniref:hypothetical protein n=1 Tax=Colwellia sp. BRX10-3 TaxID=2759844 RepID=UPI0015F66282|nr:hypothetical protein [Colwellia sp. BRX10-3]MBA6389511.1 hypothetical protein [Colwellia sp. BRX10-3]
MVAQPENGLTKIQAAESERSVLVLTAADYSKFVNLLMTPGSYPDIVSKEHAALMATSQWPQVNCQRKFLA